jgi:hypothetical protein
MLRGDSGFIATVTAPFGQRCLNPRRKQIPEILIDPTKIATRAPDRRP